MVKKERKRKRSSSSSKKKDDVLSRKDICVDDQKVDPKEDIITKSESEANEGLKKSKTGEISGEAKIFNELGLSVSLENSQSMDDANDSMNTIPQPYTKTCLVESNVTKKDPLLLLAAHSFHKMFYKSNSSSKRNLQWHPTPIQLQSWPILGRMKGCENDNDPLNIIGLSPTGSGKSLSYIVPLVHRASSWKPNQNHDSTRNVFALIVTPTRELTIQVSKVVKLVCKSAKKLMEKRKDSMDVHINLTSLAIYGGIDKMEQINALIGSNHSVEKVDMKSLENLIITCTPGRMIDLLNPESDEMKQYTNPEKIKGNENDHNGNAIKNMFQCPQMLIIDEADRVATQSDISQQVDTIITFLKKGVGNTNMQVGMFSATLPQSASLKMNDWISKPRIVVKVNSLTVGKEKESSSTTDDENGTSENKTKEGEMNQTDDKNEQNNDSTSSSTSNTVQKRKQRGGILNLSAIPSHVEQIVHACANHKKPKKLMTTIQKIRDNEKKNQQRRRKGLIIVFFGRVKTLQYIHQLLQKENVHCVQLHSQMKQERREFQLNMFRAGKCPILLATDIAARGIHVNNVEYIINYDFPGSLEQYVHRCGRAGRNKVTNEVKSDDTTKESNNNNETNIKATVYSFFHRELAPMAKDTIELLKSNDAFIDPNLLALVPKEDRPTLIAADEPMSKSKRRRQRKEIQTKNNGLEANDAVVAKPTSSNVEGFDSDEEEEFKLLQPNRIVLKRASHVSDAEDSDDNGDNE